MRAQVISVVSTKMKGKYDGYDFTYQGEPFQGKAKDPTTRFVFQNSDVGPIVSTLKAGQWVDLTFVKDGKFTNLTGVTVIDTPKTAVAPAASGAAPSSGGGGGGGYRKDDPETQLRIARSVSLKAAVDLTIALLQTGAYPKTKIKPELLVEEVKQLAKGMEGYLTLSEDVEAIASSTADISTGAGGMSQIPFDE